MPSCDSEHLSVIGAPDRKQQQRDPSARAFGPEFRAVSSGMRSDLAAPSVPTRARGSEKSVRVWVETGWNF